MNTWKTKRRRRRDHLYVQKSQETTFTSENLNLEMGWILERLNGVDIETTLTSKYLNLGMGWILENLMCRRRSHLYIGKNQSWDGMNIGKIKRCRRRDHLYVKEAKYWNRTNCWKIKRRTRRDHFYIEEADGIDTWKFKPNLGMEWILERLAA